MVEWEKWTEFTPTTWFIHVGEYYGRVYLRAGKYRVRISYIGCTKPILATYDTITEAKSVVEALIAMKDK